MALGNFHCGRLLYAQNLASKQGLAHGVFRYSLVRGLRSRYISSKAKQANSRQSSTSQREIISVPRPAGRFQPVYKSSKAYQSFADTLALRASPTLLYQAPSPAVYITGCFLLGGFCFTWAAINFYSHYLYPADDVPAWAPVFVGGVCVAMVAFGTWSTLGAYRIVRTIAAIPPSVARSEPLLLKIENSRVLPGFRPKAVMAPYSNVVFSAHLSKAELKLTPAELAHVRDQQAKMREIEKSRILTLPFRQASYWLWKAFEAFKKVWSKDGFIYIRVKGMNGTWKLDKNAAWALDDGRALDRLVKHELF